MKTASNVVSMERVKEFMIGNFERTLAFVLLAATFLGTYFLPESSVVSVNVRSTG